MQAINLLPKELRRDPTIELKRVLRTALLTTFVGVLTLVFVTLFLTNYFKGKELEAVKTEIKALEPTMQKVNSLKKEIETNDRRITVYQQVLDRPIPWSELLKDISFKMPRDIWLEEVATSITQTQGTPTKPQTTTEIFVTVKGYAPSLSSVGVFLLHLNQISMLQNPILVMAQEVDANKFGTYMLGFQIKAKVKTPKGGNINVK